MDFDKDTRSPLSFRLHINSALAAETIAFDYDGIKNIDAAYLARCPIDTMIIDSHQSHPFAYAISMIIMYVPIVVNVDRKIIIFSVLFIVQPLYLQGAARPL